MNLIIAIVFFIDLCFGKYWSDYLWKACFKKYTDEVYEQYIELLKQYNKNSN